MFEVCFHTPQKPHNLDLWMWNTLIRICALDTLEQIDVAINIMEKYSDTFAFCRTADEVMEAIKAGKVASLLGVEGWVLLLAVKKQTCIKWDMS